MLNRIFNYCLRFFFLFLFSLLWLRTAFRDLKSWTKFSEKYTILMRNGTNRVEKKKKNKATQRKDLIGNVCWYKCKQFSFHKLTHRRISQINIMKSATFTHKTNTFFFLSPWVFCAAHVIFHNCSECFCFYFHFSTLHHYPRNMYWWIYSATGVRGRASSFFFSLSYEQSIFSP